MTLKVYPLRFPCSQTGCGTQWKTASAQGTGHLRLHLPPPCFRETASQPHTTAHLQRGLQESLPSPTSQDGLRYVWESLFPLSQSVNRRQEATESRAKLNLAEDTEDGCRQEEDVHSCSCDKDPPPHTHTHCQQLCLAGLTLNEGVGDCFESALRLPKRSSMGRCGFAWSSPGKVGAVFEGHRGYQKVGNVHTAHREGNPHYWHRLRVYAKSQLVSRIFGLRVGEKVELVM